MGYSSISIVIGMFSAFLSLIFSISKFIRRYVDSVQEILCGFSTTLNKGTKQRQVMDGIGYEKIVKVDHLIIERKRDLTKYDSINSS